MSRPAILIAMVSALCLGVALGFMGAVMVSRHLMDGDSPAAVAFRHAWHGGRGSHHGPPSPGAMASHLQRTLDLTPEQANAVRGEIERTRGEFAQVRDSMHARIDRHLTPAQRDKWRALLKDREATASDPHGLRAATAKEGEHSQ